MFSPSSTLVVQETRRQGAERERAQFTQDAIVRTHAVGPFARGRDTAHVLAEYRTAAGWGRQQWRFALPTVQTSRQRASNQKITGTFTNERPVPNPTFR